MRPRFSRQPPQTLKARTRRHRGRQRRLSLPVLPGRPRHRFRPFRSFTRPSRIEPVPAHATTPSGLPVTTRVAPLPPPPQRIATRTVSRRPLEMSHVQSQTPGTPWRSPKTTRIGAGAATVISQSKPGRARAIRPFSKAAPVRPVGLAGVGQAQPVIPMAKSVRHRRAVRVPDRETARQREQVLVVTRPQPRPALTPGRSRVEAEHETRLTFGPRFPSLTERAALDRVLTEDDLQTSLLPMGSDYYGTLI